MHFMLNECIIKEILFVQNIYIFGMKYLPDIVIMLPDRIADFSAGIWDGSERGREDGKIRDRAGQWRHLHEGGDF